MELDNKVIELDNRIEALKNPLVAEPEKPGPRKEVEREELKESMLESTCSEIQTTTGGIAGDSEGDIESFNVTENRPQKGARRKEYPKENRKEKYDQTVRSSEESQYSDQNRNETHKRKRVNKHKQEEKPIEGDRNLKRLLAEQKSRYDEDMEKLRAEL